MPTRPSPRSERLGTPNTPAIRFTRGTSFEASLVRACYGLSGCSPPWTDLTEFPQPPGAFTSRLPAGWSPVPPLDMTTTATGLLCWRDFHPQEWQLASLHQNCRAGSIDSRRRGAAQPPRCATTDLASLNCDPPFLPIPYAERHATAFSPPHLATLARCLRPTALASPSTALAALWAPRG